MPGTARERLAHTLAIQDELSSSVQLRAKPATDLHLEVEGLGPVTLPVNAAQARRLRALGQPARFGRGEETLTDATVRDTWEIPTKLVQVEWAGGRGLGPELEAVREELGLPEHCRLSAELHSLLVYEKGQFFLPHQDSEKDDAMVATLVVTLPSAHSGGELVVHHLGEDTTYRGSKTEVSLVAFYADCRHEVRPVTSGHRITLTYNLLLRGNPADRVPDQIFVDQVASDLREHFTTGVTSRYSDVVGKPPNRLAFLLDHEYTERSLGWSRLKGTDASRASLLRAAADLAGCEAVLALAQIQETWDVNDSEADYGYRRGYRSWEDDEPDDDEPDAPVDDSRYELTDLLDSSIHLTRWTDPSGTSAQDISLSLSQTEICSVTPTSEMEPYSSEYEGYMGNYGNTLDRWYRRAAVVVWPVDRSFTNRAESSPLWAMDDLLARAGSEDPASIRSAAATLAPFWSAAVRGQERPAPLLTKALCVALALDDAQAASTLLQPFTIENLARQQTAPLAELTAHYGEPWTDELLRTWFGSQPSWMSVHGPSRPQWLSSLPELCKALQTRGNSGTSTAQLLLAQAWDAFAAQIDADLASQSLVVRRQVDALGESLAALIRAADATQSIGLWDRIFEYCRERGDAMARCVINALRTEAASSRKAVPDDVWVPLAVDQASRLRTRLGEPLRASDDWSIVLPTGCTCELCATLGRFLADPARRALEWPLAKNRRSHIHSRIDQAEIPVSHQTRRIGSPFILVLTKTSQLFEIEAQQRTRDQADLEWLLQQWLSAAGS